MCLRTAAALSATGLLLATTAPAALAAGAAERVSVSSAGRQANAGSSGFSISADGRFVAFSSEATNLVPGDTDPTGDVFVRDRKGGTTERISAGPGGVEGNGVSFGAVLSADGRFVAFTSQATNLVPGDTNETSDVFLHDRQTGKTRRVSVGPGSRQSDSNSLDVHISANGRFVGFTSFAGNLVPGDTNETADVFVHDRKTGRTERVSVSSDGIESNGFSSGGEMSPNGRFVAFTSGATNLVPHDTNAVDDIFAHDRQTGRTERVSVGPGGRQGNGRSVLQGLSAGGRVVVFTSEATNLVPRDTNDAFDVFVRAR